MLERWRERSGPSCVAQTVRECKSGPGGQWLDRVGESERTLMLLR